MYTRKETRINICQPTRIFFRSLLLVARAGRDIEQEPLLQQIAFTCLHREAFCLLSRSARSLAYNIYVSRADVMSSYLPLKIVCLVPKINKLSLSTHTRALQMCVGVQPTWP